MLVRTFARGRLALRPQVRSLRGHPQPKEWLKEIKIYAQKQALFLQGAMLSNQRIVFSLPFRPQQYRMTLSDLAGHCSFLFLAFSYLENDLLHLRIFAISGISLSVVFQYYREKPLWIPIRWNSLFLVINAVMILLLLKDERDAGNIPEEERLLFENLFQNKGMKPVNFLHLISNAKRLELKKGDQIVSEKTLNTRVYLVKSGQLSMVKTGAHARPIGENQFVGSMSFLSWQNRVGVAKQEKKQREQTSKWGR
eukprot:CAMPEP_0173234528 /NCGR_PEP_ID=MMETSP1142-20121109/10276_1 /TAXON_ID=483371 /ORGANISM="non described non described, Strain CCMP2298" /LENGTH=252 /DNA_ID=CAMNT_0014164579 /DNA_START=133 /DNA_END=888 /DNA_ORIENTATION=-